MIAFLQNWYDKHCNGEWEHTYGIKIETLDNPGWKVDIDLHGTSLESKLFEDLKVEKTEDDWYHCFIHEGVFKGRGGTNNLKDIIAFFQKWSSS